MSEWDFLWELEGEELIDVMSCGMTKDDIAYVDRQEWYSEWKKIKELRDTGQITREEFKHKKSILFSNHK